MVLKLPCIPCDLTTSSLFVLDHIIRIFTCSNIFFLDAYIFVGKNGPFSMQLQFVGQNRQMKMFFFYIYTPTTKWDLCQHNFESAKVNIKQTNTFFSLDLCRHNIGPSRRKYALTKVALKKRRCHFLWIYADENLGIWWRKRTSGKVNI